MRFKVVAYLPPPNDFHKCEYLDDCLDKTPCNMDLMTGPNLSKLGYKPEDLVGKEIEVHNRHVYCWIADELDVIE